LFLCQGWQILPVVTWKQEFGLFKKYIYGRRDSRGEDYWQ